MVEREKFAQSDIDYEYVLLESEKYAQKHKFKTLSKSYFIILLTFGCIFVLSVSMATSASYIPGVSLADKLRLAASKGQGDKVRELVEAGATFEPDRVSVVFILHYLVGRLRRCCDLFYPLIQLEEAELL